MLAQKLRPGHIMKVLKLFESQQKNEGFRKSKIIIKLQTTIIKNDLLV